MQHHLKTLLIGSSVLLCVGSLTVLGLTIPSDGKATNQVYLSELYLGDYGAEQKISVPEGSQSLVVEGGLMIGNIATMEASSNAHNIFVGGGGLHKVQGGNYGAIGGGHGNILNGDSSFIGGGQTNEINGNNSFVGGGNRNVVNGSLSSIFGGRENTITASNSIIAGGQQNTVGGNHSFAAGEKNQISHSGVFAWSDFDDSYMPMMGGKGQYQTSVQPNTFIVRSLNGMAINTGGVTSGVNVEINGNLYLQPGGGHSYCNSGNAGELKFEQNGCFYFCDGEVRQTLSEDFPGEDIKKRCGETPRCRTKEGVQLETSLQAQVVYLTGNSENCNNRRKEVKCRPTNGGTRAAFVDTSSNVPISGEVYFVCSPGTRVTG